MYKKTVVTNFCISFVSKIHIIGKGMIKETWIAKNQSNQMLEGRTDHILTFFCLFPHFQDQFPLFFIFS